MERLILESILSIQKNKTGQSESFLYNRVFEVIEFMMNEERTINL